MKTFVVGFAVILCVIFTFLCVFTLDALNVRQSQLDEICDVEMLSVAEDFLNGALPRSELEMELSERAKAMVSGDANVKTSVVIADYETGIFGAEAEISYRQPSGAYRKLKGIKVFILERNSADNTSYYYVRSINDETFGKSFSNGGVETDSIWRTAGYSEKLSGYLEVVFDG